jgi:UDP-N-acetylmuramoylalanine--D-glutamate ligase
MRYVLVFGLGLSGKAAASFLLSKGISVIGVDRNKETLLKNPEIQKLVDQGLILLDENISLSIPKPSRYDLDLVIVSPGIPFSHPLIQEALRNNIEVIGEVEFAFRHIQNRCIGITGTNGKTTTTLMIQHLLQRSGIKSLALGNVGVGLSSYLLHSDPNEVLVVELSSFQLETLQTKCLDLALITNITPNHLDRHSSMQEYANAKLSIRNCLKKGGLLFASSQVAKDYQMTDVTIFDSLDGCKNQQAAFAICRQFGITNEQASEELKLFQKPLHRLEWVALIDGVSFYNDSKSSNVDSVLYAVSHFSDPLILIVGGVDKGASYKPWIQGFQGKVKHVIAYGSAREKIAEEIGSFVPLTLVAVFADAVYLSFDMAIEKDVVLLSPGCSSYDQFPNFERRGDAFKELILQRKNGSKKNNPDRGDD